MDDAMKTAVAKEVYQDLCVTLDGRNWRYQRHDDDLVVTFGVSGEDLPMDFVLMVDADRQLIRLFSRMPFTVPEEKRMDLAIATCAATYDLADGSFDFDLKEGAITFRMTASFRESKIGEGLFQYMIDCSCAMVDEFNDKFLAISKGFLSIQDFLKNK